ncbi:MAG TPA: hypothetical protein VGU90_10035 [Terriglobales bacterium]|nr:hypothetical protein [Terriglobales bacterium]
MISITYCSIDFEIIKMLRKASQFAAVVLMIAVVAMPVMACMIPDRQMTPEEQNCCKKMAHGCESAVMPSSHSCCQHPVSRQAVNVSRIRTPDVGFTSPALVEAYFAPLAQTNDRAATAFESPPEGPLKISTILRI